MNRKQFLHGIAGAGIAAALSPLPAMGKSGNEGDSEYTLPVVASRSDSAKSPQFNAKRIVTTFTGHVSFPPDIVFPLLCPVREYEWLDDWQCEMIYSDSGVAEENCIFKTAHAGGMFWSVSRYEPPRRIEFTIFTSNALITRLNISLVPKDKGTDLTWKRIFTGLSEAGNQSVGTWQTRVDADLTRKLEHFLKTGEPLHVSR